MLDRRCRRLGSNLWLSASRGLELHMRLNHKRILFVPLIRSQLLMITILILEVRQRLGTELDRALLAGRL